MENNNYVAKKNIKKTEWVDRWKEKTILYVSANKCSMPRVTKITKMGMVWGQTSLHLY